jgi:hypothetical protein
MFVIKYVQQTATYMNQIKMVKIKQVMIIVLNHNHVLKLVKLITYYVY